MAVKQSPTLPTWLHLQVAPLFPLSGSARRFFSFPLGDSGFAKQGSTFLHKGFRSVGSDKVIYPHCWTRVWDPVLHHTREKANTVFRWIMGKTSPALLRYRAHLALLLFHSWPVTHPPGYSPVSLSALAHLEAWQSYAPCWPRELNPGQLEIQQRKDRTVLFLYTRYRFLSWLPSLVCFVITYLSFSGYPGSVKGERGQQECP